ncbi:MAG: glycine reductase [Firmicutes bacterium]|nr:glycine reductase [Bacillota bacterium]
MRPSNNPVLLGTSYIMVHAPATMLRLGTTLVLESERDPESKFLRQVPMHLRDFPAAVNYPPNQVFIGNLEPKDLDELPRPWYENQEQQYSTSGRFGDIWPEDVFFLVMKLVDTFDLVRLTPELVNSAGKRLSDSGFFTPEQMKSLDTSPSVLVGELVRDEGAVPLHVGGILAGCVRRAHEMDESLRAEVVYENIASKASGVLALMTLLKGRGIDPGEVEYLIECSEEAVGDMNQRGGGNLAKAIGEAAGCYNATGSDIRAFCAGPVHALVNASALVKSGAFKKVAVLAGGSPAKLGLNSRDHVAKGLPILEDMLGGFAVMIGPNDGQNPVIRLDAVGRHRIASGSSPQAVLQALVVDPLEKMGLEIPDVDIYAPELQNPELTVPAGAGDVPLANYRMIAALAVKNGLIKKEELEEFARRHGVTGFAPTQGYVPSGVPLLGMMREKILRGEIKRGMVIGKGSLFLGRMTDLFDGVSLLVEEDRGNAETAVPPKPTTTTTPRGFSRKAGGQLRIGITATGSELGMEEIVRGAENAASEGTEVVLIGGAAPRGSGRLHLPTADEAEARSLMEGMLDAGELDAAVTMHYDFPLGIATVGRITTPWRGREVFISTTTGTMHQERLAAMRMNAVAGIAVARSCGIEAPTLGVLNIEGGAALVRELSSLETAGYRINWGSSGREGGGRLLRGNDLISGRVDVVVVDSLTGNLLIKLFGAYQSGGDYETAGYGYGPGVGVETGGGYSRLIFIVSRASGAPVITRAIHYAGQALRGGIRERVAEEFASAGMPKLDSRKAAGEKKKSSQLTAEIAGIDILELEQALKRLEESGIDANSGMGCTGPILLVAPQELEMARNILIDNRLIYA